MTKLEIQNLTKRFGSLTAVDDVSLSIEEGEFMVLLGPNGAGKTTTLRCVAGLEKPEAGHVILDGRLMDDKSPAERNVAFVFQNYALYPRKTVFENIAFPLQARSVTKRQIEERVRAVTDLLHITRLLDRRPAQLSGGEQQRVALGRALVRQARIYLMDEPVTNLDFKLRIEMRTEFKRLHDEFQYTLFYVTNDHTEAMALADRIAVLNAGHLLQVGTPRQVYDHPKNRFVAGFLGFPRMNFLECTLLTDGAPRLRSLEGAWSLQVSDQVRDAVRQAGSERVTLGIRPEDVELSTTEIPGGMAGRVFVTEPLGDRTIVDIALGEEMVKVKTPPTTQLETDARVWLTPDRERLHVFDSKTERALL